MYRFAPNPPAPLVRGELGGWGVGGVENANHKIRQNWIIWSGESGGCYADIYSTDVHANTFSTNVSAETHLHAANAYSTGIYSTDLHAANANATRKAPANSVAATSASTIDLSISRNAILCATARWNTDCN